MAEAKRAPMTEYELALFQAMEILIAAVVEAGADSDDLAQQFLEAQDRFLESEKMAAAATMKLLAKMGGLPGS